MKRFAIALIMLLLGLSFSYSSIPQKEIRRVQVTAQAITTQPSGKSYVIDLSRYGAIYELPARLDTSRLPSGHQPSKDSHF